MAQGKDLDRQIAALPCTTPEQAWWLVAFGYHCILYTPLGEGERTPFSLLKSKTAFGDVLWLVEDFLSGRPCARELEEADTSAFRAAVSASGLFRNDVTGPPAAYWAVSWLVQAALASHDESRLGQVAGVVQLVARLCRQCDPDLVSVSRPFQVQLLKDFSPLVTQGC